MKLLKGQGFDNQLEQYEKERNIKDDCDSVWLAYHKITGIQVVIKEMQTSDYKTSHKQHGVTEPEAMLLCSKSKFISSLVEYFHVGSLTYIVTKLAKGGDLLNYLERN